MGVWLVEIERLNHYLPFTFLLSLGDYYVKQYIIH